MKIKYNNDIVDKKILLEPGDVIETKDGGNKYFYMIVQLQDDRYHLLDLETGIIYEPLSKICLYGVDRISELSKFVQDMFEDTLVNYVPRDNIELILQK